MVFSGLASVSNPVARDPRDVVRIPGDTWRRNSHFPKGWWCCYQKKMKMTPWRVGASSLDLHLSC